MKRNLLPIGIIVALTSWLTPAWADIVVVVSAENAIERISRSELSDLYLGRRNQFPHGEPAVPLDQHEGSQAYPEFYEAYLSQTPAQIRSHWSRLIFTGRGQPPRSVSDGEAMADAVAADSRAIGYLDSGLVDERLRVVQIE